MFLQSEMEKQQIYICRENNYLIYIIYIYIIYIYIYMIINVNYY